MPTGQRSEPDLLSVRADLQVDGMTCAACANRIQRRLGKLDAVGDAQVNFATGRATVVHDGTIDDALLAPGDRDARLRGHRIRRH